MSQLQRAAAVTALLLTGGTMLAAEPAAAAADSTPPTPPPNMQVTQVSFDTVSLTWSPARDNSGHVEFYPVFVNGRWTSGSYETGVTLNGLAPGTTYRIEVFALDADGNWSAPSAAAVTTTADSQPPTTPANLRTVSGGSGLLWEASADNRGIGTYRIFADGQWIFSTSGVGIGFDTLTDSYPVLVHGATYTFTVLAVDQSGSTSGHSNPLTVRVP